MWNQACSRDAMEEPSPGWEQHAELVSDRSYNGYDGQAKRIIVIGKTGSGKSATCNTILGEESFKSGVSASSVTEKCQEIRAVRFGQEILLVDTPGVFDTSVPNTQSMQEIAKCISLSLPGPHVFLLVIRVGRFTPEENDTVKHFAEAFGEDMFKHMILVFTGGDALEKGHQSLEKLLQTIKPSSPLDEIMEKCNRRCIAVDNSSDHDSRDIEASKLMEQINGLVEDNHGRYYTNELYQAAERIRREREEEIRRQKDQEKQKEVDDMKKQLQEEYQQKYDQLEADRNAQEQKERDFMKQKQVLEEKLFERNGKEEEEMERMKRKLRIVADVAQHYKEQVEDAKHQREICLQNRDQSIERGAKALECKYENDVKANTTNAVVDGLFTILTVGAFVGWGIVKLLR